MVLPPKEVLVEIDPVKLYLFLMELEEEYLSSALELEEPRFEPVMEETDAEDLSYVWGVTLSANSTTLVPDPDDEFGTIFRTEEAFIRWVWSGRTQIRELRSDDPAIDQCRSTDPTKTISSL